MNHGFTCAGRGNTECALHFAALYEIDPHLHITKTDQNTHTSLQRRIGKFLQHLLRASSNLISLKGRHELLRV